MSKKEPKVIGIGGILFKSKNPDKTKEWYQENLDWCNNIPDSVLRNTPWKNSK